MGKSSKKASLAVAVAATPAPSGKPDKKGKRDAEEAIEKAASVKKQRRLVEEVVPQKEEGKKPKKALLEVPSKKKPETSSSEDDTSSESEEEVKVSSKKQSQLAKAPTKESSSSEDSSSDDEPVRKVAAPAKKDKGAVSKNGSAGALTKKGKLEGSSDSDSDEDEEDVPATAKVIPAAKKQAAPVAGSKKKEESSDTSESESESDEDNAPQNKAKVDESSDESDGELQPKKLKVPSIAKDIKKQSSSSEEDEDDSSEESSDDEPSKVQAKKPTQTSKESSSSEESSEEESEDEQPLKTPKKDKDVEMEDASLKSATEKQTATKSEKKGPKTPATSENQTFGSRTIFVGNLSYDVGRDDVEEFFKVAGEVVDVRLAAADDGQFKGYGHVEFASEEAVQKALEMNGQELVGRAVRLDVARERGSYTPQSGKENYSRQKGGNGQSQTIFVRGFDKSLEEDQIRSSLEEHFGSCGEITRVSIPKDYESGAPKGIAYMDFKDQDAFSQALELNGCELGGYTLTVDEAKPRGDNRDGGWSGGRGSGWSGGRGSGRGGRDGGGRNGARFGGRGGARGGGRGRGGGGRGRGGTPYKQTMGTASAGKKTTFRDD